MIEFNKVTVIIIFVILSFSDKVFCFENWHYANNKQLKQWDKNKLAEAKKYWKKLGSTSVMVVEDGKIICEWGDSKRKIECYSLRKSCMNALYGVLDKRKSVNLSTTLFDLKIKDKKQLTVSENKATIENLLKARSGVYLTAAYETKSMRKKRPKRGSHLPDTFWYYNNWDFNTLGSIFEKISGYSVFKAFDKYIARKIQMESFNCVKDTKYIYNKNSLHPAYTFKMSTRDRARFGLLYLNKGQWGDNQIFSKKWYDKSIKSYSRARFGIGYGYLWWVSRKGWHYGHKFDKKVFSARGNHGQIILVIPPLDLVIVQSVDKKKKDKLRKGKSFKELLSLILASRKKYES